MGDAIGYTVVTYNQASCMPELDYAELYCSLDEARESCNHMRAETERVGRRERHVVCELVQVDQVLGLCVTCGREVWELADGYSAIQPLLHWDCKSLSEVSQ